MGNLFSRLAQKQFHQKHKREQQTYLEKGIIHQKTPISSRLPFPPHISATQDVDTGKSCWLSRSVSSSSTASHGRATGAMNDATQSTPPTSWSSQCCRGGSPNLRNRQHPTIVPTSGKLQLPPAPEPWPTYYDWDKSAEGGYISYRHQRKYRKRWRKERKALEKAEKEWRQLRRAKVDQRLVERRKLYEMWLTEKNQERRRNTA